MKLSYQKETTKMNRITRLEVITNTGRDYISWEDDNDVHYQLQDEGRTLKVFVNKVKPESKTKMDSVKSIETEIKMLQSKLEVYKKLEKIKSPVEKAYKETYGEFPKTPYDTRFLWFKDGYEKCNSEHND